MENDYHIPDKTLHHASPDIQSRLNAMRQELRKLQPHKYKKGQMAASIVVNYFQKGCKYFHQGLTWKSAVGGEGEVEEDVMYKVDAADLGV